MCLTLWQESEYFSEKLHDPPLQFWYHLLNLKGPMLLSLGICNLYTSPQNIIAIDWKLYTCFFPPVSHPTPLIFQIVIVCRKRFILQGKQYKHHICMQVAYKEVSLTKDTVSASGCTAVSRALPFQHLEPGCSPGWAATEWDHSSSLTHSLTHGPPVRRSWVYFPFPALLHFSVLSPSSPFHHILSHT